MTDAVDDANGGVWSAVKTFISRGAPKRLRQLLLLPGTPGSPVSAAKTSSTPNDKAKKQKYQVIGGKIAEYNEGDNDGDNEDNCDDDAKIGVGQAGTRVYRAINVETGQRVAIKAVSKKVLTKQKMGEIRREAKIMAELAKLPASHGLVKFYDFFEDKTNIYIVMELMEGGELFTQIANRGSFTELDACTVVVQVAETLRVMHNNGFIHRDLKPENLLCGQPDSLDVIKLCDFGMTKRIDAGVASTPCGTVTYVAPEVIIMSGDDMSARGYGRKADVWSLGVILYVLLSGRPPFYDSTPNGVMNRIRRGDYDFPGTEWAYISVEAKELIIGCLQTDPAKRFSIDNFLAHPWIAKAKSVPAALSPRLQSPEALRNASLPINEFFKLLMPRLNQPASPKPEPVVLPATKPVATTAAILAKHKENQKPGAATLADSQKTLVGSGGGKKVYKSDQKPPAARKHVPFGLALDDTDEDDSDSADAGLLEPEAPHFFRWRVSDTIVFEVPHYYRALRLPKFTNGHVSCVAWSIQTGSDTIMRKMSKISSDREQCYRLSKEITILQSLQHENIASLMDGFVSPSEDVYLIGEMHDTTLGELLLDRQVPMEVSEVQMVAFYLFRGLNHLHSSGLIHRDIKPNSLFINLSFNKVCSVKIGDLSKARHSCESAKSAISGISSESRHYRAPELHLGAPSYDSSIDIWAAACCIGEMLLRKLLFPGGKKELEVMDSIVQLLGLPEENLLRQTFKCEEDVIEALQQTESTKHLSSNFAKRFPVASTECIDLLRQILVYNPCLRPSAASLVNHAFFGKFKNVAKQDSVTVVFTPSFDERPKGINWKNHLYKQLESFHEEAFVGHPMPSWSEDEEYDDEDYETMSDFEVDDDEDDKPNGPYSPPDSSDDEE